MEQLLEILQQIQELSGVAVEAIQQALGGAEAAPPAEGGAPGGGGEAPPPEAAQ